MDIASMWKVSLKEVTLNRFKLHVQSRFRHSVFRLQILTIIHPTHAEISTTRDPHLRMQHLDEPRDTSRNMPHTKKTKKLLLTTLLRREQKVINHSSHLLPGATILCRHRILQNRCFSQKGNHKNATNSE